MSTHPLRALIVDDERAARANLRRLLGALERPVAVEECDGGAAAVACLRRGGVELVLLDIQMPGMTGLDVVRAVGADAMPPVIFTTAHEEYALEAFGVDALGYLLKPVRPERLARLVARVPAPAAPATPAAPAPYVERLAVRERGRTLLVPTAQVEWIEARGVYARLHTAAGHHDLRQSLTELERLLSPREFARVHRGAIVRVDRIREIQPWFNGEHVIVLHGSARITTGPTYRAAVSRLLGHH